MPSLLFRIGTKVGYYEVDFRTAAARPTAIEFARELVAHFADHRVPPNQQVVSRYATFLRRTLDFMDAVGAKRPSDFTDELFTDYIKRLSQDYKPSHVRNIAGFIRTILCKIDDREPIMPSGLREQLAYRVKSIAAPRSKPRNSYSPFVVEQLRVAAQEDVRRIERRFKERRSPWGEGGERYLTRIDEVIEAEGSIKGKHLAYRCLFEHCRRNGLPTTRLMEDVHSRHYLVRSDLPPIFVLLSLETGIEIESLKFLKAGSLTASGPGKGTLEHQKTRVKGITIMSPVKVGGTLSAGGLIRAVTEWSATARERLGSPFLFCHFTSGELRGGLERSTASAIAWAERHQIVDDNGQTLVLSLSRLRKVVKKDAYIAHRGEVRTFSRDHSLKVRVLNYAEIESNQELHESVAEDALHDIEALGRSGDLSIVSELSPDSQETWLATCDAPRRGPYEPAGTLCSQPLFGCLGCDNAVYSLPKLPALLGALEEMRSARELLSAAEWEARFGGHFRRIDQQILSKFPTSAVEAAAKALQDSGVSSLPEFRL
ncbi:hypothetical protein [Caulobacter sp. Root1472]|uniref:hypothetical protein n=1 Tax=Caulobacter sp. Root1472 TaxID=1736470 RepID=UPI0012E346D9|nr:hypothetical protein [Caulobacter sp. Root1472]